MYRVLLERAAEKDLGRLSASVHDRVIAAIQRLTRVPRPTGCRKLTGTDNDWRIRVGDYRVIYEITDDIRVVTLLSGKGVAFGSCGFCRRDRSGDPDLARVSHNLASN